MEEKLKKYLEDNFLVDFDEVDENQNLFETGYIDSFGYVELVVFLEENFEIEISQDELLSDNLISYHNILRFIERKK